MEKPKRRNSILKRVSMAGPPPVEAATPRQNRRISFGKNTVKEFLPGDDKVDTIWGKSYEESAQSLTNSNSNSISATSINFSPQLTSSVIMKDVTMDVEMEIDSNCHLDKTRVDLTQNISEERLVQKTNVFDNKENIEIDPRSLESAPAVSMDITSIAGTKDNRTQDIDKNRRTIIFAKNDDSMDATKMPLSVFGNLKCKRKTEIFEIPQDVEMSPPTNTQSTGVKKFTGSKTIVDDKNMDITTNDYKSIVKDNNCTKIGSDLESICISPARATVIQKSLNQTVNLSSSGWEHSKIKKMAALNEYDVDFLKWEEPTTPVPKVEKMFNADMNCEMIKTKHISLVDETDRNNKRKTINLATDISFEDIAVTTTSSKRDTYALSKHLTINNSCDMSLNKSIDKYEPSGKNSENLLPTSKVFIQESMYNVQSSAKDNCKTINFSEDIEVESLNLETAIKSNAKEKIQSQEKQHCRRETINIIQDMEMENIEDQRHTVEFSENVPSKLYREKANSPQKMDKFIDCGSSEMVKNVQTNRKSSIFPQEMELSVDFQDGQTAETKVSQKFETKKSMKFSKIDETILNHPPTGNHHRTINISANMSVDKYLMEPQVDTHKAKEIERRNRKTVYTPQEMEEDVCELEVKDYLNNKSQQSNRNAQECEPNEIQERHRKSIYTPQDMDEDVNELEVKKQITNKSLSAHSDTNRKTIYTPQRIDEDVDEPEVKKPSINKSQIVHSDTNRRTIYTPQDMDEDTIEIDIKNTSKNKSQSFHLGNRNAQKCDSLKNSSHSLTRPVQSKLPQFNGRKTVYYEENIEEENSIKQVDAKKRKETVLFGTDVNSSSIKADSVIEDNRIANSLRQQFKDTTFKSSYKEANATMYLSEDIDMSFNATADLKSKVFCSTKVFDKCDERDMDATGARANISSIKEIDPDDTRGKRVTQSNYLDRSVFGLDLKKQEMLDATVLPSFNSVQEHNNMSIINLVSDDTDSSLDATLQRNRKKPRDSMFMYRASSNNSSSSLHLFQEENTEFLTDPNKFRYDSDSPISLSSASDFNEMSIKKRHYEHLNLTSNQTLDNTSFKVIQRFTEEGVLKNDLPTENAKSDEDAFERKCKVRRSSKEFKPNSYENYIVNCPTKEETHSITILDLFKLNNLPNMRSVSSILESLDKPVFVKNVMLNQMLPDTPPIDVLENNALECLMEETIVERCIIELPSHPLIPPIEYLLENKLKGKTGKWTIDTLNFPGGLIRADHKSVKHCYIQIQFNCEQYLQHLKEKEAIPLEKVTCKQIIPLEKLSPFQLMIQSEVDKHFPSSEALLRRFPCTQRFEQLLNFIDKIFCDAFAYAFAMKQSIVMQGALLEIDTCRQLKISKLFFYDEQRHRIIVMIKDVSRIEQASVIIVNLETNQSEVFNNHVHKVRKDGIQFLDFILTRPEFFFD